MADKVYKVTCVIYNHERKQKKRINITAPVTFRRQSITHGAGQLICLTGQDKPT